MSTSADTTASLASGTLLHSLAREFQDDVRRLSKLSAPRALAAIAFDWCVIVTCFATAVYFSSPLLSIICAALIAARQHALLIIMHDASHFRLLPNRRWNDRVSNWLLAYPMLVTTEAYRHNHLAHHLHLNSDDDPDWVRKRGRSEWQFPKNRWQLFTLLARDLVGGGFLDTLKAIHNLGGSRKTKAAPVPKGGSLGRAVYYIIIVSAIYNLGIGKHVLLYWFLPAFTLLPVMLRVRSIAEHFGLEATHELNASRNYRCGIIESAILAPHNVGYHLDHHLFPSVPFYNLPSLHLALSRADAYRTSAHLNVGIVGRDQRTVEYDLAPR
jgi:fatty acid desaturase